MERQQSASRISRENLLSRPVVIALFNA